MSWGEIRQSFVILSLFIFEPYVIEIFLQNSILMLHILRSPSWCHVSSGRHIGWLRPNLLSWKRPSWHKISASSKTGKLCTIHNICGNIVLSQRLTGPMLADVVSRQFRAAYQLIKIKMIHMSWSMCLPSLVIPSIHMQATRDWAIPSKLRFDYIYPSVAFPTSRQFRAAYWLIMTKTLVEGGILQTQDSSSSKTRKLCTINFTCGNLVLSQRLTDPILAEVVSCQFRAAYWLITTKLIHMYWSRILPSLVIFSLFTFELQVIELFLPKSVLMQDIRQWQPGVTSIIGGILDDYNQKLSRG